MTTNVNDAFPRIGEFDITIEQDPFGYYSQNESQRTCRITKATLPNHVQCINSKCQQGGIDTQSFLLSHSDGEYMISCNGHEGTLAAKRIGDPCDNYFKIKLTIERK